MDEICGGANDTSNDAAQKTVDEWFSDASEKEASRPAMAESDPQKIVDFIDDVAKELEKDEAERLDTLEIELLQARFQQERESEKVSYGKQSENSEWLAKVVSEAEQRGLPDDSYSRIVDPPRVNRVIERDAVPKKSQTSTVDYLRTLGSAWFLSESDFLDLDLLKRQHCQIRAIT